LDGFGISDGAIGRFQIRLRWQDFDFRADTSLIIDYLERVSAHDGRNIFRLVALALGKLKPEPGEIYDNKADDKNAR
jgi:hypothetical protein